MNTPSSSISWHCFHSFCINKLYAVECNLMELTTKGTCIPTVVSGVSICACIRLQCAAGQKCTGNLYSTSIYSDCCFAWEHIFKHSPFLPSFFPLFPLLHRSMWGLAVSSSAWGLMAHSWEICQLWERSLSKSSSVGWASCQYSGSSWMSLAPNLCLAMQLLIQSDWFWSFSHLACSYLVENLSVISCLEIS